MPSAAHWRITAQASVARSHAARKRVENAGVAAARPAAARRCTQAPSQTASARTACPTNGSISCVASTTAAPVATKWSNSRIRRSGVKFHAATSYQLSAFIRPQEDLSES